MIENWKNTEHLGDCLEIMKLIPDNSIDFICTDLPYGTTACKWDTIIPFVPLWEQYNRIIKLNGAIALFGSEPFSSALRMSNIDNYKYDWIWHKNTVTDIFNAKTAPLKNHEIISIFAFNRKYTFNRQKEKRSENSHTSNGSVSTGKGIYEGCNNSSKGHKKGSLSNPKSVQFFKSIHWTSKEKNGHATQKPVALIEYLIRTYSNENEIVLDSTAGSFTLAEACLNTNRNYIVIEKDTDEFKKGSERIKKHKQKLAEQLF